MRVIHAPQPQLDAPEWAQTPAARRGAAGERAVRAALASALDDRYVLLHNLYLPGGTGDIDIVVIGPRVLVLEVKTYAGERPLRVRGMRWEYQTDRGHWMALDDQPSLQAEANARRVAYALRSAGLPAYGVTPAVVLVGGAPCILERARIPVLRPSELPAFAREGTLPAPAWPDLALRALLVAAGYAAGVEYPEGGGVDGQPPSSGR